MSVIFYAIGGEGMGHATRSEVIIKHLIKQKHKIVIFSYDRALEYLIENFKTDENVLEFVNITGINFVYRENKFKIGKTIIKESSKIQSFIIRNTYLCFKKIIKYNPNLIINDFEPFTLKIAKLLKIPLICIDNINFYVKCNIDKEFTRTLNSIFVEYILNFNGDINFITTVFSAPIKEKYKNNTYIVGPIIREELTYNNKKNENFILVYQTSISNVKLLNVLKHSEEKYVIYGFNKELIDKNLIFKSSDKSNFAKDLKLCKAVISNGGYTLISEAVILNKPIYSIPIKYQLEQEINGYYIEKSGYGVFSKEINIDDLNRFLNNLSIYKENISNKKIKKNDILRLLNKKVTYFTKSYQVPTSIIMINNIKNTFDNVINELVKVIDTSSKTAKLLLYSSYLYEKTKSIKGLLEIFKEKNNHEKFIRSADKIGFIENEFVISDNEQVSYCIYKSEHRSKNIINIVFLHGLGGNKSAFNDLIFHILKLSNNRVNFNILTVDLAGHGKSTNFISLSKYSFINQSRIIVKIINKEFGNNSRIIIVGHCFGSFISIKLVKYLYRRTEHLFLISSNPFLLKYSQINFKLIQNKIIQKALKLIFDKITLSKNITNYGYEKYKNSSDYNVQRVFIDIKNTSLKGYFSSLYSLFYNSTYDDFKVLLNHKTVITLIHGEKDRVIFYKGIKQKAKKDNVELFTIHNSNHLPIFNASSDLAEIIVRKLNIHS